MRPRGALNNCKTHHHRQVTGRRVKCGKCGRSGWRSSICQRKRHALLCVLDACASPTSCGCTCCLNLEVCTNVKVWTVWGEAHVVAFVGNRGQLACQPFQTHALTACSPGRTRLLRPAVISSAGCPAASGSTPVATAPRSAGGPGHDAPVREQQGQQQQQGQKQGQRQGRQKNWPQLFWQQVGQGMMHL